MKSPRAWRRGALLLIAALAPGGVRALSVHSQGQQRTPSQAQDAGASGGLADFDHLRRSVIRIQAVSSEFDWFRPFAPGPDGVGLGSGFVVQAEPYPLFVTNAHVVSDAKQVSLQLLLFGAQHWTAEVVSVCQKFDLALLVLKEPQAFKDALSSREIALEPLKLAQGVASMGMDVVALGFPLGQDALKISKGNVAGNEDVNGNICIQSTAPISPGNSGGPLLDAAGREVVGVNFAKATAGENINYVIPVWRVQQMITKHLKDQPEMPKDGQWTRIQVKVPDHELTTIVPNEPLFAHSGGCSEGIYISRIGQRSPFRRATPAVEEGSFLISVNGKQLDKFGTGLDEKFVADRVAYSDLLFMVDDFTAAVEVTTCKGGKPSTHKLSMEWAEENDKGLQYIDEPNVAGMGAKYEMFGDMAVMQMTVNHISAVLSNYGDPGPARWMYPDFVMEPRLVISWLQSGSYSDEIFSTGSAVSMLNGHPVRTLEEFSEHFHPKNGSEVWSMETDLGEVIMLDFNTSLKQQLLTASALNAPHMLTNAVIRAAESLGLREKTQPVQEDQNVKPEDNKGAPEVKIVDAQSKKPHDTALAGVASQPGSLTNGEEAASLPLVAKASGPIMVRPLGKGRRGYISVDNLAATSGAGASSPVPMHMPVA